MDKNDNIENDDYIELLNIKGQIFCIKQTKNESREQFFERIWIIINNYNKYINNINKLICLSKMSLNIKYYKCIYKTEIMDEIKTLKLYSD